MEVLRLTDKRFMIKTSSDGENYLAENGLGRGSMDDVCNRLNGLNQMVTEQAIQLGCLQAENKDFRIKIDYHKRIHERFKKDSLSLVEENQVYKQKIKDTLQERYNTFKHDYEMAVKGGMPSGLLYDEMDLYL